MSYATVEDVQKRMLHTMTADEQAVCETYLEDAAVYLDTIAPDANDNAKKIVSCNICARLFGVAVDIPVGATQGSMSGLGYAQSWTISGGGSTGEIYLSKWDKRLLGIGNRIGSRSPVEDLTHERDNSSASD